MLQYVESWGGSAVVHVVLIAILALVTLTVPTEDRPNEIVSSIVTRPDELMSQHLDDSVDPADSLTFAPSGSVGVATHGDVLASASAPELSREVVEALTGPEVKLADVSLHRLPGSELNSALGKESPGDPAAAVEGMGQALDRLSQQLLTMLSKNKVLVIWLFDQSESMVQDQQQVKQRLQRVYEEMRLTTATEADALLSSVASFGEGYVQHTRRPTTDLDAIRAAIDEIPLDDSGEERTFQAVIEAINGHRRFAVQGRRQLAVVVVTDESGDDEPMLDAAIKEARAADCSVYVLGYEAAFGYPYAYLQWVDPETGLSARLPMRRGPETPAVEQLQTNGLWRRHDWHSSGFGPYNLVRLCRETGGTYFILPQVESNLVGGNLRRKFELEAMRPYLPDLGDRAEYLQQRMSSPLRAALWEVIVSLDPTQDSDVELREYWPRDPARFVAEVPRQRRKAEEKLMRLDAAEQRLAALTRERQQEPSLRWQANYDIVYAQVIAYKVRVYEYMAYVEAFVQNPKAVKDPKTTHWRVQNRKRTITGDDTAEYVEKANALLREVIEKHPGTPFAARAEWELNRGYGIEMVEHYHDPRHDQVKWPKL